MDGGLDLTEMMGYGPGSGCVLRAASLGLAIRWDVGYDRDRGVKDDFKIFTLLEG